MTTAELPETGEWRWHRGIVLARIAPVAISALAFVHGLTLSWRKLGSLLIDTGRELEVPREIVAGRLLYRDIRFYWGPLGPYLNAALYRVFGVSIDVEMWAGIAAAALMLVALYRLAARFGGPFAGAAAAVAFVYAGAFPRMIDFAIFNFVLPFNCDATYGMVAAIWSLCLLLDHLDSGRPGPFLWSAVLLGLTALAKLEVFLPALAAHALFAIARPRRLEIFHAIGWAAAFSSVAAVYAFFAARTKGFFADSLGGPANAAANVYIRRSMGFDDGADALIAIAVSLLSLALIAAAAYGIGRVLAHPAIRRLRWSLVLALAIAVALVERLIGPLTALRAMPLLLVIALAALAVAWWRSGREDAWLVLGLLSVFALACFARIPLRSWPAHYGFYLLPPSFVCVVALPAQFVRSLSSDVWMRRACLAATCGILVGVALGTLQLSQRWYGLPYQELRTAQGMLLVHPDSPEPVLIRALQHYPKQTRAVVVPEGAGLVFASDLQPGDSRISYLPMVLPDERHDRDLAAEWTANPPDVVLFWRRDYADFGFQGFGVDYAKHAAEVLKSQYVVRGDFEGQFLLLERRR